MQTFQFLMVLIIIICVLITLVILSQNPKGGGLSSAFGGSSGGGQMFGVQRTNEFLDKATWTLAIIIVVLVITANVLQPNPYATTSMPIDDISTELPALPAEPATPGN